MSAKQDRIISQQQATIQALQREISRIRNLVLTAEVMTYSEVNGQLAQIMNDGKPVQISRFRMPEVVLLPISAVVGSELSGKLGGGERD